MTPLDLILGLVATAMMGAAMISLVFLAKKALEPAKAVYLTGAFLCGSLLMAAVYITTFGGI